MEEVEMVDSGSLSLDAIADNERVAALTSIVPENGVVLDVGANRGQFARELLSAVTCTVYAFEPVPAAYQDLVALAEEFPSIHPVPYAVSDVEGIADLHVQASDVGSSMLVPLANQSSQWLTPSEVVPVETVRIDRFMTDHSLDHVDLLKSDAQGFDGRVISSAGDCLDPDRIGAILVETNFHAFYADQDAFYDVMKSICEHGYFLAGFFRHYNHSGWLWWADVLYLPNRAPFSTQFSNSVR
ncbi:MAG: FkbM family methyltransferase [Actinobacteria bacterium]|nr:FkbM family methyltransferase [Actinomycetota bacterium]